MAKIKGEFGTGIRGKAGGLVFSEWKGIQVLKTVPVRSKNSWSEKQALHRQRFKAINDYCKKYKYTLIPQIWNLAAENGHGYNLFLKANSSAFALDGTLTGIDRLHFSAGRLPLPMQFRAQRSGTDPSKVEVSWINDENLPPVYEHDGLIMVCAYPDHFTDPVETGVQRKAQSALTDLPENPEAITGIWLWFSSPKKDGFSPDQWFQI